MPPIDTSIINRLQPFQPAQQDSLGTYAKVLGIQGAMGQQDLQGLQTQQLREGLDTNQRLRALYAGNPNATAADVMAIDPKTGMAVKKAELEAEDKRSEIDKRKGDILVQAITRHRDALSSVNDPQTAAQWVAAGYQDPILKPHAEKYGGPLEVAIQRIPQDPQGFAQWKQQAALGATKFMELNKPHISTQDTGGASNIVATPGLGGAPTVLSTTPKTLTPGEVQTGAHQKVTEAQGWASQRETNRHHAAIEGDPETIEVTAKGIAEGRLAPLSGFALSRPMGQQIMSRVVQMNPEFDPTQFATRQKAEKDFGTGKPGQSVRSFNVALSHLDTLDQLATALNNKDTQVINRVGNAIATQTGNPAPTNFEAAKKIVADEIVKAIVGSGGGVTDREEAAKTIQAANSPAQLKGVINTYKELMRGQLGGLRQQYEQTTGKKDFDRFLSESGKAAAHGAPAAAGSPAAPAAPTTFNAMPDPGQYSGRKIRSDDGTTYESDGKTWKRVNG